MVPLTLACHGESGFVQSELTVELGVPATPCDARVVKFYNHGT